MEEKLLQILKEFGQQCYWYAEQTGDYDLKDIDDEDFLVDTLQYIMKLLQTKE
jgi:hypothetical protein